MTATINWCKFEITQFPIPRPPRPGGTTGKETASRAAAPTPLCPSIAGGGVYIVMQGDKPIYVGETESFADRWHARLRDAFQIGLINIGDVTKRRPEHLADVAITMYLGVLAAEPTAGRDVSADKRKLQEKRKLLESAIIRALAKGGSWTTLRNDRSFNAFRVSTPLQIIHVLPPELAQRLTFARHPKAKGPPPAQDAIDAGQIHLLRRSPAQLLDLKKNDVFELGFYETPRTATPPGYLRMT